MKNPVREKALSFVGEEEVRGNLGFKDEDFEKRMKEVGWEKGQAWCAYFIELIAVLSGFKDTNLFSGSAVQTWNNFSSSSYKTSQHPKIGSLVIWQNYKYRTAQWSGHAGVVVSVDKKRTEFVTVEGNTNSNGEREGYEVSLRIRDLNFDMKNGLNLKGFIYVEKNNEDSKSDLG